MSGGRSLRGRWSSGDWKPHLSCWGLWHCWQSADGQCCHTWGPEEQPLLILLLSLVVGAPPAELCCALVPLASCFAAFWLQQTQLRCRGCLAHLSHQNAVAARSYLFW